MPSGRSPESPPKEVGESIPSNTTHAISVTLPTWQSNVAYEEGEQWVHSKLSSGYPRFKIHIKIEELAKICLERYGNSSEGSMLFPSRKIAEAARSFILNNSSLQITRQPHVVHLSFPSLTPAKSGLSTPSMAVNLFVLLYPLQEAPLAKSFWQHTGYGISSRMAEYCLQHLSRIDGPLDAVQSQNRIYSNPLRRSPYKNRHYTKDTNFKPLSTPKNVPSESEQLSQDQMLYLEERYGRNLDVFFAGRAKLALQRRIAGTLSENVDLNQALLIEPAEHIRSKRGVAETDVWLFPTGMSAIWTTHQLLLKALPPKKSVCFGFTYVDTLKILEKWGPGCYFYGHASSEELDNLEQALESGERVLALFCEFPSNPLLVSPDLRRIRTLADKYDFAVVVDETIGNFINIAILDCADIVVSSLTKIFSGDANVMGGSIVLNPHRKYYSRLKETMEDVYEDVFWPEDAVFLERNSRDFIGRIHRINVNAEAVCETLQNSPHVKRVFYPKCNPSRPNYDAYRTPEGGYGGLLSAVFQSEADAIKFYDAIETSKGPSLGTNFTLTSPYTILAHYTELEWAAKFGVERSLVRISVGLEEKDTLVNIFTKALGAIDDLK